MILAVLLSLNGINFEIRTEGQFNSMQECVEHFMWRRHHFDFRKGDVTGACLTREETEEMIRRFFGGRA